MPKPVILPIPKGNVRLRLLEPRDLPQTLAWRNQDNVRRWFVYSAVLTNEQHLAWFEKYQLRNDDLVFMIEETVELNKPVGQVSLYNIEWENRRAEFGRLMIGENDARGKGIARTATAALLEFGFKELGLEEIHLEVFKDNSAAYHIYESLGFAASEEKGNLILMRLVKQTLKAGG